MRKGTLHGTASSYTRGCRCHLCRDAMRIIGREYRVKKAAEDAAWEAWKNQWKEAP